MKIAILYICTGRYSVFLEGFHESSEKYFLPDHEKTYFVFSDSAPKAGLAGVEHIEQANLGWPGNTLDRYAIFGGIRDRLAEFDHIFFFNANCQFIEPVGEEMLALPGELVVVSHPGQFGKPPEALPYERDTRSSAFIAQGQGRHYVAGGVNGGTQDAFLALIDAMQASIERDKKAGVMATWHDESHLNRYIIDHPYKLLDPGYCYPEGWEIPFQRRILVRDKKNYGGHQALRRSRKWGVPENAIVVELLGRMGNQMFQYAAARAAALRSGSEVILDTRLLARENISYELGHFAVHARAADKKELCPPKEKKLKRFVWRTLAKAKGRFIREKGNAFEPRMLSAGGGSELRGYWQSEQYFADHTDMIRIELSVSTPPSPDNAKMLEQIRGCCSVSVHVRRGDYVSNAKNRSIYAACGPAYYSEAAAHMLAHADEEPVFFVFSDDPDWAEENLEVPGKMIVVRLNGPDTGYEDLRLMANCRHNIIANSSFSWWGGWLNGNPGKIVIGPATWYLDPKLSNEHIMPAEWVKIDNLADSE